MVMKILVAVLVICDYALRDVSETAWENSDCPLLWVEEPAVLLDVAPASSAGYHESTAWNFCDCCEER